MDYDASTVVTWEILNKFATQWPGQLVYLNMPAWFWPLVMAGVLALIVIALTLVVRTVMGR